MTGTRIDDLRSIIVNELGVMKDDIHVTSDKDTMTFYLPPDQVDQAENVLKTEVEVLEEYDYEYLVAIQL